MINTSNLCTFEGRISKDPEFSQFQGKNGPVDKVVFDLAVDRGMNSQAKQNAQQNNEPTADFIHCNMIGAQVAAFRQFCPKGKAVKIVCRYHQFTYIDKNTGETRYGHDFDVDSFGFVTQDASYIANNGQQNNNQQYNNQQFNNGYQQNAQQQQQNNFNSAPQPQNNGFDMFGGNNQGLNTNNSASPF